MGQKSSRLKVTAEVTVVGSASTVDTIRLDSYRSTCCGGKWKRIASFSFPRKGWSSKDPKKNSSSNVAKVPLEKLRKKDGDTPVRVTCLVAGVSVFRTETTLNDLLRRLEITKQGDKAVLMFTPVGRGVQANKPKAPAFMALFLNGKWYGGNGVPQAVDTSGSSQKDDAMDTPGLCDQGEIPSGHESGTEGNQVSCAEDVPQRVAEERTAGPHSDQGEIPSGHESGTEGDQVSLAEDVPQRVAEERTAGPHSDGDQDDVMFKELLDKENVPVAEEGTACRRRRKNTSKAVKSPAWSLKHEEDLVAQEEEEKCQHDYCSPQEKSGKSFRMKSVPARHKGGNNQGRRRLPGYNGSSFWDHVASFAGVVALGLIVYNAWQEYLKHGV